MDRSPAAQDPVPQDPYLKSQMDIDEKVYLKEKHLKIPLPLQALLHATGNSYNRQLQPVDWDRKRESAFEVFAST